MFCWQCGKEIYQGAFFCTNCGMKVIQPQVPTQEEAPGAVQNDLTSSSQGQESPVQMLSFSTASQYQNVQKPQQVSEEPQEQGQQQLLEEPQEQERQQLSEEPQEQERQQLSEEPQEQGQQQLSKEPQIQEQQQLSEEPQEQERQQILEEPRLQEADLQESGEQNRSPMLTLDSPTISETSSTCGKQEEQSVAQSILSPQSVKDDLLTQRQPSPDNLSTQQSSYPNPIISSMEPTVSYGQNGPLTGISQGQAAAGSAMPQGQDKLQMLPKSIMVAVIVVAVILFLIGVTGAFYYGGIGNDFNDSLTLGQQEEVAGYTVDSQKEDVEEENFVNQGELSGREETNSDNSQEALKEDPKSESEMPGPEDSQEEPNQEEKNQEEPKQEDPWGEQKVPAFSGRDVYPGIEGYAEGRLGDSMHTYWFDYTVTGAYVCMEYGGYTPVDGYEILVVEIAVKNTFEESIPMFDDDFQAQWNDPSDDAYAFPIEDAERLGENILPAYYVLEENQVAAGLLLFEVPAGYSEFSLAFWELFDDDSVGDLFFLDFTVDRKYGDISL